MTPRCRDCECFRPYRGRDDGDDGYCKLLPTAVHKWGSDSCYLGFRPREAVVAESATTQPRFKAGDRVESPIGPGTVFGVLVGVAYPDKPVQAFPESELRPADSPGDREK